jgi:hypothetical protein
MVARYRRLTRGKHFCMETWEMTRYTFNRLTGGQSMYLKVKSSCFSKASMAPNKLREGGTSHFWMDGEKRLSSGKQ